MVTSHAEIEQVALRLFTLNGFEKTTLGDIANELGIGRRTLFRYYVSKNDIPWGQFDQGLDAFRLTLAAMPTDIPLHEAIHRGVLAFNSFDESALLQHRQRMRLILTTPALQAHSALRYADWRRVIAEYVADRTMLTPDDLFPRTIGHVSLALALAAYEHWLGENDVPLLSAIDETMGCLQSYIHN